MPEDTYVNYDDSGKFIPRQKGREKYTDYYGPVVVDDDGDKAGKFFLKEYQELGHLHLIGEIVVIGLFAIFFLYGAYNMYFIGKAIQQLYIQYSAEYSVELGLLEQWVNTNQDAVKAALTELALVGLIIVGVLVLIYVILLAVSFLIVRVFSALVEVLMYASLFFQIGLLIYSYMTIEWDYNWVFVIS